KTETLRLLPTFSKYFSNMYKKHIINYVSTGSNYILNQRNVFFKKTVYEFKSLYYSLFKNYIPPDTDIEIYLKLIVDLFPTNLQFKYSLQQTKDINKPIIPITKVGNKNILFKTLLYRRSIFQYINNNAQFPTKFFIDNNYLSIGNIGIIERLYNSTSKNIHR